MGSPALNRLLTLEQPWHPRRLLAGWRPGALYLPRPETCRVMSDGTGDPAVVGDPVGWLMDESGNGHHATQATTAAKPILRQDEGGRYYLEGDGVDDFLETGLLNFASTFFIASAVTITGGSGFPGPWRFLREGGSSNRMEEYYGGTRRRHFVQRTPSVLGGHDATDARPVAGNPHVSWINNAAPCTTGTVWSGSPYPFVDIGARAYVGGSSTLSLFRGYSGSRMNGRIYGFVYVGQPLTDTDRERANRYLTHLAGVAL